MYVCYINIIDMVDQVAYKCYLGLALEKVIKDMDLNSKSHKIFEVFI